MHSFSDILFLFIEFQMKSSFVCVSNICDLIGAFCLTLYLKWCISNYVCLCRSWAGLRRSPQRCIGFQKWTVMQLESADSVHVEQQKKLTKVKGNRQHHVVRIRKSSFIPAYQQADNVTIRDGDGRKCGFHFRQGFFPLCVVWVDSSLKSAV